MPAQFVKRHWVTVGVVAALALGTVWNHQAVSTAESAREKAQADQIRFNLGACRRGHELRATVNGNTETLRRLRAVVLKNVTIAAETDPSLSARLRWRAQADSLENVRFTKVLDPDCRTLVRQQTPPR